MAIELYFIIIIVPKKNVVLAKHFLLQQSDSS